MAALDDMKAVNVKVFDVRQVTDVSDCMVLASGNSDRHVRSIADRVIERAKQAGFRPMGVEGQRDGEWVLVDLNDVIVHVMLPRVREFYGLEELWEAPPPPAPKKPRQKTARGKVAKGAKGSNAARGTKRAPRKAAAPARRAPARPAGKPPARKSSAPRKAKGSSRPRG
jgi:ribosome-associated protein